jgi:hypothetical protein
MKKRLLALLFMGLALVPSAASAATLDQQRLDAIRQHCTTIQTLLDQLQRRDLVARTNRGRAYEAQIKQIDALDKRLETNNIAAPELGLLSDQLKVVVDSFRAAYVAYDDNMTLLRKIDCRNNMQGFSLKLEEIRVLRQAVGVEVTRGEQALSEYRKAVVALRALVPERRTEAND